MIQVKICGIQRPEDALAAAQSGADFIGLVFVPERHRRLTLEYARNLVGQLRDSVAQAPQVVGLFADQPLDEVNHAIDYCGLDLVQLCGQESYESLDYCSRVRAAVIKVLHVAPPAPDEPVCAGSSNGLAERIQAYRGAGHRVTLDRLVAGLQGGTGQSFDWDVAARIAREGHQFLLAGGLDPDNVAQAIAQVHPWGVDVSSGVETDGAKDPAKIRAFIASARGAAVAD